MHAILDVCDNPGLLDLEAVCELVLHGLLPVVGIERVSVSSALGRVAVDDVRSPIPLPAFAQSAVDGFGIHASDLESPRRHLRVAMRVAAGSGAPFQIGAGQTATLLTGAAIPHGVAAVVMREKTRQQGASVTINSPAEDGQNIRWEGEDVPVGSVLVPAGSMIDARHIAILAAAGIAQIAVRKCVRVGIISNGDELVDAPQKLKRGQVYDTNRPMLLALLSNGLAVTEDLGRTGDNCGILARALSDASGRYDLIVSSGGVSGSDADHVVEAVRLAGGASRRLSVAMKPGKPLAVGRIGSAAVLSLPGNCVAAMVGALLFARPMIWMLAGAGRGNTAPHIARAAACFSHKPGRIEFVPVRAMENGADQVPTVVALGKGGSARLRPVCLADGFAAIPKNAESIRAGEMLAYYPFKTAFNL